MTYIFLLLRKLIFISIKIQFKHTSLKKRNIRFHHHHRQIVPRVTTGLVFCTVSLVPLLWHLSFQGGLIRNWYLNAVTGLRYTVVSHWRVKRAVQNWADSVELRCMGRVYVVVISPGVLLVFLCDFIYHLKNRSSQPYAKTICYRKKMFIKENITY